MYDYFMPIFGTISINAKDNLLITREIDDFKIYMVKTTYGEIINKGNINIL